MGFFQETIVGSVREFAKGLPGSKRSSLWRKIRNQHINIHPNCAVCGKTHNLQVHHIVPFSQDPDLELSPYNLITLCRKHHLLFGHLGWWSSWNDTVVYDSRRMFLKIKRRPNPNKMKRDKK
jgi:hypothetical protein